MASSRRRLHVALRLRANEEDPSKFGTQADCTTPCVSFVPPNEARLQDVSIASGGLARSFFVDSFLPQTMHNQQVFEQLCRPSIDACADAAVPDTLCFLAYGHTNSGKTHTIAGAESSTSASGAAVGGEQGILSLCALHLLHRYGQLDVTMLEVYSESVYDMLARGQQRRVRRLSTPSTAASRGGSPMVVVEHLSSRRIRSEAEWSAAAECGWAFRKSSPMDLNARSSRSHAIFTLKAPSGVNICLIDLAGSERQSIFTKQLNRESITINKSLSRLSTVIRALGGLQRRMKQHPQGPPPVELHGGAGYVNFRDTTLTVLLQRYLTGSSLTTIIACVHPHVFFLAETLSTLRYTARLHNITTEGVPAPRSGSRQSSLDSLGSDGAGGALVNQLQTELARLKQQLADASFSSTLRDKEHTNKIELLESAHRMLAAQLDAAMQRDAARVQSTTIELELSSQSMRSVSSSAAGRRQQPAPWMGGRSQDTKRVAGWLLSRCISSMPQFNVIFDDYFHNVLPPNVTSIGYVTCMACLLPRDDTDASVRLGVLDAGDMAMALTMLDAGIPPFVRLHDATCRSAQWWESFELGNGAKVYALAMFDVSTAQIESMCIHDVGSETQDDGTSPSSVNASSAEGSFVGCAGCCTQFSSFEAIVPFAVVFAVDAVAPLEHHQAVYDHLTTLCMHQDSVEQDVEVFAYSPAQPHPVEASYRLPLGPSYEACGDDGDARINEPLAEWAAAPSPQRSPGAKSDSRDTSHMLVEVPCNNSTAQQPPADTVCLSPLQQSAMEPSVLDVLLEQIYARDAKLNNRTENGTDVSEGHQDGDGGEDEADVSALTEMPGFEKEPPRTCAAGPPPCTPTTSPSAALPPVGIKDVVMAPSPWPGASSADRSGTPSARPIDSWMCEPHTEDGAANAMASTKFTPVVVVPPPTAPSPPAIRRVAYSESRLSYASESPLHRNNNRSASSPSHGTASSDASPHWTDDPDAESPQLGAHGDGGDETVAVSYACTPVVYRGASLDDGCGTRSQSHDLGSSVGPSVSRGTSPNVPPDSDGSKHHQLDPDAGAAPATPQTQCIAVAPRPSIVHDITPIGPQRSHALWKAKKKKETKHGEAADACRQPEESDRRAVVCEACTIM